MMLRFHFTRLLANRIFAENCRDEAAKATLKKFGMRV